MPREYGRNQRVADLLQRELALIIQKELSIPETGLLTISFVDVSPDLRNAKVYFTCLNPHFPETEIVASLNEKAGYFRHLLAQTLPLRGVPRLVFLFDHSISRANRLSQLIDVALTGSPDKQDG